MSSRHKIKRFTPVTRRPVKAAPSCAKLRQSLKAYLGSVCSAKRAREYIGLSLQGVAAELSRLASEKITRDRVRHFESGHSPISENIRCAYGQIIANYLTRAMRREIAVTLAINSPWRITPYIACARCGRWTPMVRDVSKHCPDCSRR